MAVLLGGLMMYGLQPGPMLFKNNPKFVWAVIASMYIGNVMLLVLNLPLVGLWARIAVVHSPSWRRSSFSVPCLELTASAHSLDVWVMLVFGLIGYFMRKAGVPHRPIGVGIGPGPDAGDLPAAGAADFPRVSLDFLYASPFLSPS